MSTKRPTMSAALGRGVVAGLAGTAAMTAFQKAIEMPLTGRSELPPVQRTVLLW